MPKVEYDVIIIGAGIVGAASAYELTRLGQRVLIIERGRVGGGTTSTGMGHLVVIADSEAQLALTRYSVAAWQELSEELPSSVEYEGCGTLWLATDENELEAVIRQHELYSAHAIESKILDGEEVRALEPNLRPGLAGALQVGADATIYPPTATRWLIEQARGMGAELWEDCEVKRIEPHTVVLADVAAARYGERVGRDARVSARAVVNAAGFGATDLVPGLPVSPRKGHLLITDRYPGFCHHQLVELGYTTSAHTHMGEAVAFNVQPRRSGQLLIGSSREYIGRDPEIDRRILSAILERALSFLPSLGTLSVIRSWVGFRPATPDNLPLIGRWPEVPGLWVATGHEGLGITTALGTARLITALLEDREAPIDPAPYDPARVLIAG